MDTPFPLRYNARAVSGNKVRNIERERFASEIMTHLDHLYRVAFFLAKNPDDAQDCVQETCARALSAFERFAPGTNLKAWLTRILYNFFLDSSVRNKRTVSAEGLSDGAEDQGHFWESLATPDPGPERQVLERELSEVIGDALKAIPEEFRAPIILVDLGDYSYQEAAEVLACPIGTVRSRLSRGRRLLQKRIGKSLG